MSQTIWILNGLIAFLAAVNAVCWGYTIRQVNNPQLTLSFLLTLALNKYFIMAIASAFTASLLGYVVMSEMGVLGGRFFISLSTVTTILACVLILGERLNPRGWLGVALIITGVMLIGRW